MAWAFGYAYGVGYTFDWIVGDNFAGLYVVCFDAAGNNAFAAEGLYQRLAAFYCYGPFGRGHSGSVVRWEANYGGTCY